jgi:hypothetical protein
MSARGIFYEFIKFAAAFLLDEMTDFGVALAACDHPVMIMAHA